jgi:methyl-accepting chemotaxis protein
MKAVTYMRNMSLAHRVALFIAFILLAFVFILQQYRLSLSLLDQSEQERLRLLDAGALVHKIETEILAVRQPEKEFLLRGDLGLVYNHNQQMQVIYDTLEQLQGGSDQDSADPVIRRLRFSLGVYSKRFAQVVDYKVRLGLDRKSGMIGQMHKALVAVERAVKGSNDLALAYRVEIMRGHERDFLNYRDEKYFRRMQREEQIFNSQLANSGLDDSRVKGLAQKVTEYRNSFYQIHAGIIRLDRGVTELRLSAGDITPVLNELRSRGKSMLARHKAVAVAARTAMEQRFLVTIILVAVVVTLVLWFATRGIVSGIRRASEIGSNVARGDLSNQVEAAGNDEVGTLLKTLDRMQTQLRESIEKDRKITLEALRIQTALDNVSTSVLVLDRHYRIIYMNQSALGLFEQAEAGVREQIPEFSAAALVGGTISDLHCDRVYTPEMLDAMTGMHQTRIAMGGYDYDVTTSAVHNGDGERVGTVLEWRDVTGQLRVEQEVGEVIAAVSDGDFEQLISLTGKQGFYRTLGAGINEITNVVSESIVEMDEVLRHLAEGRLSQRMLEGRRGALASLAESTNLTIARLEEIITRIRETASRIATLSSEISFGNEHMSQRTESQATSLEETASTMEEFTGSIRNNARSAHEANKLAADARGLAEKGGLVVGEAVAAMQEISDSSEKISNITAVINDIAFQTNLLALNASVEAARAGEQGRGFAVVATEVRNLAGRSAEAAREIKGLIQNSRIKVESGSLLVNQSGENLKEIVQAVQKVNQIIAEIAAASGEQAAGVEQVNHAIADMDGVTQQNAALAEQTSAVSHALTEQAYKLEQVISFFNEDGDVADGDYPDHGPNLKVL